MAEYYTSGSSGWRYKLTLSTSVSGLTATISYNVKTYKGTDEFNGRKNSWCNFYRGWQANLATLSPIASYDQSVNGKNPYNEDVLNKEDEWLYSNTTVLRGSFNVSLNSEGKASLVLSLVGRFGNKIKVDDNGVLVYDVSWHDTINITGGTTKPGNPSISITDNGNNSFTLYISKGSNGTNNPATGYEAQYTTNSTWTGCSNGDTKSVGSDCTAKLKARTLGEHYNSAWVETSAYIKYYGNPSNPGKPTLSSKKEGKPTLKEDLTFRWTAATAGSSHAPIKGYRIRLKVNGSFYDLDPNSANDYINTGNTNTYWTIPQSIKDTLKVKDTIQLSIYAYSTNGVGTPIFNGGGTTGAQVLSDIYTISSNGVVRVNVPGLGYKSGVVYVKDTSGNWKEAQGVFANSGGSWKESQ